jgi:hypothetical protein
VIFAMVKNQDDHLYKTHLNKCENIFNKITELQEPKGKEIIELYEKKCT